MTVFFCVCMWSWNCIFQLKPYFKLHPDTLACLGSSSLLPLSGYWLKNADQKSIFTYQWVWKDKAQILRDMVRIQWERDSEVCSWRSHRENETGMILWLSDWCRRLNWTLRRAVVIYSYCLHSTTFIHDFNCCPIPGKVWSKSIVSFTL